MKLVGLAVGAFLVGAAQACCEPQEYNCCTTDAECCTEWGQLECSVNVCVFPGTNATLGAAVPMFKAWQQKHGVKFYTKTEEERRLATFVQNDALIRAHNAKAGVTYTLAHNKFSAMTKDEFRATMLGGRVPKKTKKANVAKVLPTASLAVDVDWVTKGAVTPVKNQGGCGSCWAFSTTGAMEGALFTEFGTLESLSEQQLVSCDTVNGPQGPQDGCNGGYMDAAFDWIGTQGGLCKESDYPYTSANGDSGKCKTSCQIVANTGVLNHTDVEMSDAGLMSALNKRPVSVAIEADQSSFQFYSSGVMTGSCGAELDHGVLAVGYGTMGKDDYYKVKNSWGPGWGDQGYILLARGDAYGKAGQCGILSNAAYPELAASAPTPVPPPTAPTPPPTPDVCDIPNKARVICPDYAPNRNDCEAAGCCWDDSVPINTWCYVKPTSALEK